MLTDGESNIPVHFHKNSLAAHAYVRSMREGSSSTLKTKGWYGETVRTIVQLNSFAKKCIGDAVGWRNSEGATANCLE